MTAKDAHVNAMLYDTRIGKWLAVFRIQSAPVTILPMLLGYCMEIQQPSMSHIGTLSLAGLFAHLGMYGYNEYQDYGWDVQNRDANKPLVQGGLNRYFVRDVSILLIFASVAIVSIGVPTLSFSAFILGVICGFGYNLYSKTSPTSALFFGFWGLSAVLTGAFVNGSNNPLILLYAIAFGLFCLNVIICADIRDMNNDEVSIPKYLNSMIDIRDGIQLIFVSYYTRMLTTFIMLAQLLLLFAFLLAGADYTIEYPVVAISGLVTLYFQQKMVQSGRKDNEKLKHQLAGYAVGQAFLLIGSASIFLAPLITLSLITACCIWVFGWLYIIYSDPLYFP